MNIFRIVLGIIVATLGLGMAWAGWAVATYGQWTTTINVLIGFILGFFGLGIMWSGIMLVQGTPVREALGGMVTALPGHRGVGLPRGVQDRDSSRLRHVLGQALLYTVLAIVIILIGVLSVGRVMRDFRAG